MKNTALTSRLIAATMTLVAMTLPGCRFDTSGLAPGPTFSCPGTINRYAHSTPVPPPTDGASEHSGASILFSPLAYGKHLYPDQKWVPSDIPLGVLKGTQVLRIPYARKSNAASNQGADWFLELTLFGRSVDKIWIAFDERSTHPPNWLPMTFKRVGPPLFLRSSESYFNVDGVKHVRYQLWQPKAGFADFINSTQTLGGNNGPGTAWRGGKIGSQYLVIIRMRPQPVTSTKTDTLGTTFFKVGAPTQGSSIPPTWFASAKDEAMAKWLAKPGNHKYMQAYEDGLVGIESNSSSCSTISQTSQPLMAPHDGSNPTLLGAWVKSSHGEIDHTLSTATVTVGDHAAVSTHLRGSIDFSILDGNSATIENVNLWGDDLRLGDGTYISKLTVSQLHGFAAFCSDGLPHAPQRLCTQYEVPPDPEQGFAAGAALKVEGHDMTMQMENSQPMTLNVDLNAMSFAFSGGPLTGSFEVNGQTYTADISLSIEGTFTNLAPAADVSETQTEWECGDTGSAEVLLSAAASTDELDPADITGFDWYEDRSALTQAHLGSGSNLKSSMIFGAHYLTLEVSDGHGSSSTTDFVVDVVDTRIDSLQLPPDRWVQLSDPAGTWVDIGTASASDICSGRVDIENNAPASRLFRAGFTPVTWSFDDTHGNLVRHTQKIFVLDPAFMPPPVSEIEVSLNRLTPVQSLSLTHHTFPQGRGMLLDETIVIRDGSGGIWSIDSTGAVVRGITLHATLLNLGVAPTSTLVFSGAIGSYLPGPGLYTVEAILVQPGGDSQDRSVIVSWSQAEFEIVAP